MSRTTTTRSRSAYGLALILFFGTSLMGCAGLSKTEKGAATGAGAGAVIGAVIGKATGNTAKGAIIGAAAGGVAGAVIGEQMDKQAKELEEELEGAEVVAVKNPETGETAGIQVTFDNAILFGFDSAELSDRSLDNLNDLASSLQQYDNTELVVIGHTDSKGSDSYNQELSERRANAAASYLINQGVASSRVTTIGKGETDPVADNDTDYGRQQNRRVEIAIYPDPEYVEQLDRENG